MFLKVLPKKYHKVFFEKDFPDSTVEKWLHIVVDGQPWEKTKLRQDLTFYLDSEKPVRFVGVSEITPAYKKEQKGYAVQKATRGRKKRMLAQLVQVPQVKYAVGSPEYIKAMQQFQTAAKKLRTH